MQFSQALDIVETYGLDMLSTPNSGIEAVGIGNKEQKPITESTDFCITAVVQRKMTSTELQDSNIEPFEVVSANCVGAALQPALELDVVESGGPLDPQPGLHVPTAQRGRHGGNPPALNAQKDFQTLRCGIGITNPVDSYPHGLSVGTLGFFVRDEDGDAHLVSNNHVIGRLNDADNGDPVVQPGTLDLTGVELQLMPDLPTLVAQLGIAEVSAVVPLQFRTATGTPNNFVDAAMARLNGRRPDGDIDRLTFGGGIAGVADPYQQAADGSIEGSARVYKVGRTTGYTEGEVFMLAAARTVNYRGKTAHFVGQILVRPTLDNVGPFSNSGDSGSGVLNDRNEIMGLLFAGSPNVTIVNPIERVLDELEARLGQRIAVVTV